MSGGIDYAGVGATCNRDPDTGIRYGIIPRNDILQAWSDSSEPDYGEPHCPECGNEAVEFDAPMPDGAAEDADRSDYARDADACNDYACDDCKHVWDSSNVFGDEPNEFTFEGDGYKAFSDDAGDVWCVKSPYYTRAQFCSPCAPGACHLSHPCADGERAYCFGSDWFDDEEPCPYPIYNVSDDACIYTPEPEPEPEPTTCPACGSENVGNELGALGNRVHYRCRYCGMDYSSDLSR
jgi:hypothetical protein